MANQPTKYRKFIVGAASAALVASAVAPVASAKDFKDTKGNTHEAAIDALSDAGVISGYEDGTFKPNKTLTRSDVVKMMGKWLVAEGYEVPADAVSNPRFTDLKSTSNKELLEYAAVVKDNGVFNGSNGRLLAGDNITRENMAVVLVRAFDTVKSMDLASYVEAQDFKKDVKDLNAAKSEARPAIDVLDFFDITNPTVANFNPKGATTRGHFATFLHKALNTDFSDVTTGVVAPGVAAVKGINATTVEVSFKDAVENLNSLNFTIEGLTVSNAAVKQSDNKTVVLTTAVQEGGKEYTVSLDSKAIGSFKGVSAVVPTTIEITQKSVQGKVGAQAILSADVGVKQAGIPVTFNVKANTMGTLNKDQVFEAVTDANGIATFSYTQYAAGRDSVVAYPTGAPAVRSLGYVFWGVDSILTVEEVTEGATINNGANKTYKVTYKDDVTGKPMAGQTFNVSFLENLNVSADKIANATVNGVQPVQMNNNTPALAAQITTDSKGEATFTVSGTNTEVTPVVFNANNTVLSGSLVKDFTYEASDLQVTASKVKFAALQADYTIDVTRAGNESAALQASNGSKYNIVVKDKDGKLAANEVVNVAFNEDLDRVISTVTEAKFIKVNADGSQQYYTSTPDAAKNTDKKISVKTNAKGEASFVIGSDKLNDYATPVAWIDVNTPNAVEGNLDEGEPKAVAPITYFVNAYLAGAELFTENAAGVETSKFEGTETATFKPSLVNQSGKEVVSNIKKVSYTIWNTGANDILVDGVTISPNRSHTVNYDTAIGGNLNINGGTELYIKPVTNSSTSVKVVATGIATDTAFLNNKDYAFTAKEATATFTSTTTVADTYTGIVAGISKAGLTFENKAMEAFGASTKFYGGNGSEIFGAQNFVDAVILANAANAAVTVTFIKDTDGNKTFKIVSSNSANVKPIVNTAAQAYVTKVVASPTSDIIAGETVTLDVTFSDNVTLANDATVTAGGLTFTTAGATNSKDVVFTYVVQPGDAITSLDVTAIGLGTTPTTVTGKTVVANLALATGLKNAVSAVDTVLPAAHSTTPIVGANGATSTALAIDAGDTITIKFSEKVLASNVTLANLTLAGTGTTFGTAGATISPVTATNGYADSFVITLGTGTNVAASDTITIAAANVKDQAGNVAAAPVVFTVPAATNF